MIWVMWQSVFPVISPETKWLDHKTVRITFWWYFPQRRKMGQSRMRIANWWYARKEYPIGESNNQLCNEVSNHCKPNLLTKVMTFQLWNVTRRPCSSTTTSPQTRCWAFAFAETTHYDWNDYDNVCGWNDYNWNDCDLNDNDNDDNVIEMIMMMRNVCCRNAALLRNTKSFWLWWRNVSGWCARWFYQQQQSQQRRWWW